MYGSGESVSPGQLGQLVETAPELGAAPGRVDPPIGKFVRPEAGGHREYEVARRELVEADPPSREVRPPEQPVAQPQRVDPPGDRRPRQLKDRGAVLPVRRDTNAHGTT